MGIDLTGWAAKLFDEVCAAIGGDNAFPPDEPEDARELGRAWGAVADLLQGAVDSTNTTADKIFTEWTDTAGYDYHAVIKSYNGGIGGLITSCREMQKFCDQYAHDIEQQRWATRIEMIINAASFALAFTGGGAVLAGIFARRLAAGVMKRMLLAAARTTASAQGRTTVRTVALDLGKEIVIESTEEFVISAGSQLATGGIDGKQLATDTLAGGIGGVLGYGPGKLVTKVVKPKGIVGQHVSAAATGGGLNAVTSPVASVAAHDVVNGELSGWGDYRQSIVDNAGDAARMGAFRANGNVAASQAGSLAGTHANAGRQAELMSDLGLSGPDGPPPQGTPASPDAVGGASGGTGGAAAGGAGAGGAGAGESGGAGQASGAGQAGSAGETSGAVGQSSGGAGQTAGTGGQSGGGQSGAGAPGAGQAGAGQAGGQPGGAQSGAAQSATGQAGTAQSGGAQSGAAQSGAGQAGSGQSGVGQSGNAQAGTAQSGGAQSGAAQSSAGQAGAAQSGGVQSGAAQSATGQAGTAQSGGAQSGAGQAGTAQSGGVQSGVGQAGAAQSGGAQSTAGQAGTTQSGSGQSGAVQSTTGQAGTAQSGGVQSNAGQGSGGQSGTTGRAGQPGQSNTGQGTQPGQSGTSGQSSATGQSGTSGRPGTAGQAGTAGQPGLSEQPGAAEQSGLSGQSAGAEQSELSGEPGGAGQAVSGAQPPDSAPTLSGQAEAPTTPDSGNAEGTPDNTRPAEIAAGVWHALAGPVQDAIARLFGQRTTSQVVKNAIARLATLDVPADAKQEIAELAGKLPPTVLKALVDIAERASSALGVAVSLARENRAAANRTIRQIRDLAGRGTAELRAFLDEHTGSPRHAETGPAETSGQPAVADPQPHGNPPADPDAHSAAPNGLAPTAAAAQPPSPQPPSPPSSPLPSPSPTSSPSSLSQPSPSQPSPASSSPQSSAPPRSSSQSPTSQSSAPPSPPSPSPASPSSPSASSPAGRPPGLAAAVEALLDRNMTIADEIVTAIHALADKMAAPLLSRYLTNIAETVTRTDGKTLADFLAGMSASQLHAFHGQLVRLAARPSLPQRFTGVPPTSISPAQAGGIGDGKGFVQEAADVHAMLDRLEARGADVTSARKALADEMRKTDLQVWAESRATKASTLQGNAQGLYGIFAEVEAALALAEMHPALREALGLPGLTITGLRIGKDPDVDILARLGDGTEVRIEVKDHTSFAVGSKKHHEIAGQVGRHRAQLGADGLVISLFTNDVSPAVADALITAGADMVLRYDGFGTFSVMAERPAPTPAPGSGVIPTPTRPSPARTAATGDIAQAAVRDAVRFAEMATGRTAQVTADAADLGGSVAATYLVDDDGNVRVTVSSRVRPAEVPGLVAAALTEALAGTDAGRPDFLVPGSTGDPVLSARDQGRAAQVMALDQLLRQAPWKHAVRAQLRALIADMGLDPAQPGAADRMAALPDERMRDAVRRRTRELDGLPATMVYLARSVVAALPVPVSIAAIAGVANLGAPLVVAIAATSLARAFVHGLYDRPQVARDLAAMDERAAGHGQQLADRTAADVGHNLLTALAQLRSAAHELAAPEPGATAPENPDAGARQWERIYGIRRYAGTIAATAALGVVMVVGAVTPVLGPLPLLAALGLFAPSAAATVFGPVLDARRKRYTMAKEAALLADVLTKVDGLAATRRAEIAAQAKNVLDQVRALLPDGTPGVDALAAREFLYGDDIPAQAARVLLPQKQSDVDKDNDPTWVADHLHLTLEHAIYRSTNAGATAVMNLAFGGRQYAADVAAIFEMIQYDASTEAGRDVAAFAAAVAAVLGATMTSPPLTPLADDAARPSGMSSKKWYGVGAAAGLLSVAIAAGFGKWLGLTGFLVPAAATAHGPVGGTLANRLMFARELAAGDVKAEVARVAAQQERDAHAEALGAFGRHVLGDTPPPLSSPIGDAVVDKVLAARDDAYRALVEEVRRLLSTPDAPTGPLGAKLVDRVAALHDIAATVEALGRVRAHSGQARAEAVLRDRLVAAIQKYNGVPGVTALPVAGLYDGVHQGNADRHELPGALAGLPALPEDVNGQVAAVTRDQQLARPGTPVDLPGDLSAFAGNEGWAARVAAAAGVPGGRFVPAATFNDIAARMRRLGTGGRAIVHAARTDDSGVATSGALLNAVTVDGQVYFLDARTGAPADLTPHTGDLTVLVTAGNDEATGPPVVAKARAVAAQARAAYEDLVPGSLLTDPAAPGLTDRPAETGLADGLTRIAQVINPDRYLPSAVNPVAGNDMPPIRVFSDRWDTEDRHAPDPADVVAGLGLARATAGFAVALLAMTGGDTGTPEYRRLTDLLGRDDAAPSELLDAMTDLLDALLPDGGPPEGATVGAGERKEGPESASTVDRPERGAGTDLRRRPHP